MIKIGKNNKFKIVDAEKLKDSIESTSEKLLGKYDLFFNTALGGVWCHNKTFGDAADLEHGSYNTLTSQLYMDKGYISLSCDAYGGMCGFTFSELDIAMVDGIDRECMEYTFNYLKELYADGIIENPSMEGK